MQSAPTKTEYTVVETGAGIELWREQMAYANHSNQAAYTIQTEGGRIFVTMNTGGVYHRAAEVTVIPEASLRVIGQQSAGGHMVVRGILDSSVTEVKKSLFKWQEGVGTFELLMLVNKPGYATYYGGDSVEWTVVASARWGQFPQSGYYSSHVYSRVSPKLWMSKT